jgi:hypothetical protein
LISFFRLFLLAESLSSDKVGSSELKLMSGRSYAKFFIQRVKPEHCRACGFAGKKRKEGTYEESFIDCCDAVIGNSGNGNHYNLSRPGDAVHGF